MKGFLGYINEKLGGESQDSGASGFDSLKSAATPLYTGDAGNWQWGGTKEQVEDMRAKYKEGISEAQARQAPTAQNVTIEQAPQDQFRTEQMALLNQLQQQASGLGPASQGEIMAQRQAAAGVNRAQALAASARGINPIAARRGATEQIAELGIAGEQQRQMIRAQEQLQAQQGLSALSNQMRGQDIGLATSQAGLEMQTALANQQAQQSQQAISDQMVQFYENMGFSTQEAELQAQIAREQMLADIVQQQINAQAGIVSSGMQSRAAETAAGLGAIATGVNTYYRANPTQPQQQQQYQQTAGSTAQPTPPPPAL